MLPSEPGIIGQICEVFRKRTDSPDAFLHAGALTILAALIGKKVCISYAGKELTPWGSERKGSRDQGIKVSRRKKRSVLSRQ